MIDRETFAHGLVRLAVATGKQLDDAVLEVYHEALEHQTDAAEWEAFTRASVVRWRWFPTLSELVDALSELRGQRPPEIEAGEAYERVLGSSNYTPEGGASWNYRDVRERCGVAAAEAFLAAGGHSAFASTWDESKRRDRFMRTYVATVRAEPTSRLLPPPAERHLLTAGPDAGDPTRDEARAILQRIAQQAGGPAPGAGGGDPDSHFTHNRPSSAKPSAAASATSTPEAGREPTYQPRRRGA